MYTVYRGVHYKQGCRLYTFVVELHNLFVQPLQESLYQFLARGACLNYTPFLGTHRIDRQLLASSSKAHLEMQVMWKEIQISKIVA